MEKVRKSILLEKDCKGAFETTPLDDCHILKGTNFVNSSYCVNWTYDSHYTQLRIPYPIWKPFQSCANV